MMRLLASLLLSAAAVLPAHALSDDETIGRWYAMLTAANSDGLAGLLADGATIRLTDLGIDRSKAEFLATMGEWKIAVAGAGIRHKVESTEGPVTTVVACYDFAENDILMRETFRIENGLVTENTQATIAQDCGAF